MNMGFYPDPRICYRNSDIVDLFWAWLKFIFALKKINSKTVYRRKISDVLLTLFVAYFGNKQLRKFEMEPPKRYQNPCTVDASRSIPVVGCLEGSELP